MTKEQFQIRQVFYIDGMACESYPLDFKTEVFKRAPDKFGVYENNEDGTQCWICDFDTVELAKMALIGLNGKIND